LECQGLIIINMLKGRVFRFCNIDPRIVEHMRGHFDDIELDVSAKLFDSDELINSNECIFQFTKFDLLGAITSVSHTITSPVIHITIRPLSFLWNFKMKIR